MSPYANRYRHVEERGREGSVAASLLCPSPARNEADDHRFKTARSGMSRCVLIVPRGTVCSGMYRSIPRLTRLGEALQRVERGTATLLDTG